MTKIHLMGIGGSGMSAAAYLAEKEGYKITGCDLEASSAYKSGISRGHSASHLKGIDYLVFSPAILYQNPDNPELVAGEKAKIAMTWQEFAGKFLAKDKKVICVAGTHGKSTTTAMTGKLLQEGGFDPSVLIGARIPEWNGNARDGKGEYFVIEADEFNDNFLNYYPEIIILNNIEFDHPDYFKNEDAVFKSFRNFLGNLRGEKILIANEDSEGVIKLLKSLKKEEIKDIKLFVYSLSKTDHSGNLLKIGGTEYKLGVPGSHNLANALGVITLASILKIDQGIVQRVLQNFKGIGRRLELIGRRSGIEVYDDYAHHPTAIAATLEALRSLYPKGRIWAVYEAHGFARSKALLAKYKGVFKDADRVIVGPIFKARDKRTFGITPQVLAEKSGHKAAIGVRSFDNAKEILLKNVKPKDVILVMGAGKSYLWAREIVGFLPMKFSDLTTFRIGGTVRNYFEVKEEKGVRKAVSFAKKNGLPIFVIGRGSDILAGDKVFAGVVIRYVGENISDLGGGKIKAEAGVNWDDLVEFAVGKNLQGIECMSGIPGTVGAAPIQNIGAYGQELKNTFWSLTAYDIEKGKFVEFDKKACQFSYRESIFKKPDYWQKFIITDVILKLVKNGKPRADYESLSGRLGPNPTLGEVRNAVLSVRSEKLEDPQKIANAGSFFKNPIVNSDQKSGLAAKYPDLKMFPFDGKFKLSAAQLIEMAGWKGKTYKGAGVSKKHALILVNEGGAKASDVYELSERIIMDVKKKFGVTLEREVQLINFNTGYKGKKIAILGYGIEGQDAERYFKSQKTKVKILDREFSKNYLTGLDKFDVIVRSPGVYRFFPEIVAAEEKGTVVTSAIKVFFEECPANIIGVTGTKGKGTTASLIYEILKANGRDVHLVGNIGKPYLEILPKLTTDSWVIMEMSSFQLVDLTVSPHIAVVLNITMDHMDWHKNVKEYIDAKKNIVLFQKASDFAVINEEYDTPRSFAQNLKSKVIFFSKQSLEQKFKESRLLRGEHNLENISAAVNVAKIVGVGDNLIGEVVRNFKGLEHRLELVEEVKGRTFYNDSFATGPQPTIAAINSFTEPETLILGGSDKGLDYLELGEVIGKKQNVRNVILIGQIRDKIKRAIKRKDSGFRIWDLGFSDMESIVRKAFEITEEGGVIILSPAAASFDMFKNYKDRGEQFKKAVALIK